MEDKNIKIWNIFIGVLILIGVAYFVMEKKDAVMPAEEIPENITVADGEYCFSRDQVATAEAPYAVSENIKIKVAGSSVSGTKSGTQNGPDMTNGYDGALAGTISGKKAELVYSYTIEGSQNKEKEIYEFVGDNLQKIRYVLVEQGGMLVPDMNSTPTTIVYKKSPCEISFGEITTKYITAVDWPPKVEMLDEPFSCTEVPLTGDVSTETKKAVIDGKDYCVSKISEGAAGSTYTTYTYARDNAGKTETFKFTLRFVQCDNYDDPKKSECKTERANFSADSFFLPK